MKIETLYDLLVHELQDLYDAETQITKALPQMAKAASSGELRQGFEKHLAETENQLERLEQVFSILGQDPTRKTCKAMQGLLREGNEIIKEDIASDVLDAALIVAAQKVEHYEIAAYGTVRTYAEILNYPEAAMLLQTTLDEEGDTNKTLTVLSRRMNQHAV